MGGPDLPKFCGRELRDSSPRDPVLPWLPGGPPVPRAGYVAAVFQGVHVAADLRD